LTFRSGPGNCRPEGRRYKRAGFQYNVYMLSFQLGKLLVFVGVLLVGAGLLLMAGARFSLFGLGRLPGDIVYKGKHVQFYFPIVTCVLLSAVLTLVLWIVSHFTKR
jgi:hypothetical protein